MYHIANIFTVKSVKSVAECIILLTYSLSSRWSGLLCCYVVISFWWQLMDMWVQEKLRKCWRVLASVSLIPFYYQSAVKWHLLYMDSVRCINSHQFEDLWIVLYWLLVCYICVMWLCTQWLLSTAYYWWLYICYIFLLWIFVQWLLSAVYYWWLFICCTFLLWISTQWLLCLLVSIAGNKSGDVIMRSTLGGAVHIFQWSVYYSVESILLVRWWNNIVNNSVTMQRKLYHCKMISQ